jgi:ATP adenylyltransferase
MEHLWAPWRAEYFRLPRGDGCFLCNKASQHDEEGRPQGDEANLVVLRGRACFALLNTFPYTGGHTMVAPYRHTAELDNLADEDFREMMHMLRRCRRALTRAFHPNGFNIGLNLGAPAGAGIVEHFHWHIVPRWTGDTNFMTVLADNRVVSEGLRQTFEKMTAALCEEPTDA